MSETHLDALELSAERVAAVTDFYESYATLALRQGQNSDPEIAGLDAASALRSAGQWTMILDPQRAADLLVGSARLWHQHGHGFGTYLLAALRPAALPGTDRRMRQRQLQVLLTGRPVKDVDVPAPLLHPQQQAYLLLAGAGGPAAWAGMGDAAARSVHRLGVVPIGALGTPLRVYWDIAMHLLSDDGARAAPVKDMTPGLEAIAGHLEAMAASYATAINSAMANEYLWFSAASPVDVGDVDIAAIAALAARRFGIEPVVAALSRRAEQHDPLTRVPLELAVELAVHVMRQTEPPRLEEF
ncbi:hypothetical protein ACFFKH_23975 [Micromonospora marina]|uniref:Uncharacterized protein n=1 Tax=Micromonospora marina TaxID=307120 RepID=A0A1C4V5D7_9ACTN|nr:hypothetical protein [Micromonospora marina]SCE79021.1 hypothetical protein GA0070215_102401 [Micromonospora marina]